MNPITSIARGIATTALSQIGDSLAGYASFWRNGRSIGGIIPHVVIEEVGRDELAITEHPVEMGAAIADHAFRRPAEVEMRIAFSDSAAQAEGYCAMVYQQLLALQRRRQPFDVVTGKRAYRNMLVRGIQQITNEDSENALDVTVILREVLITKTSYSGGGGGSGGGSGVGDTPADQQATPQSTSAPVDNGPQALVESPGVPSYAAMTNVQWGTSPSAPGLGPYGDLRPAQLPQTFGVYGLPYALRQ